MRRESSREELAEWSLIAIKIKVRARAVVGGEPIILYDPGSELRLGRMERERKKERRGLLGRGKKNTSKQAINNTTVLVFRDRLAYQYTHTGRSIAGVRSAGSRIPIAVVNVCGMRWGGFAGTEMSPALIYFAFRRFFHGRVLNFRLGRSRKGVTVISTGRSA